MRSFTGTEDAILRDPNRKVYYQVLLDDEPVGFLAGDHTYDPFISGRIEANVGQRVQKATFTFHLGKAGKSLSPYLSFGIRGSGGDTGKAIYPGKNIQLRTAVVPPGGDPDSAWRFVFRGQIDSFEMDGEADTITVQCRDDFALEQDKWIDIHSTTDQGTIYGFPVDAARVDVAMAQVNTLAYEGAGRTIQVIGTPTLAVSAYWQEQMGLLEALTRLGVTTTGWDLRGKWDLTGQDRYDLTYYNPDRPMTASAVTYIGMGTGLPYHHLKINSSLTNVRNRCDVIPANDLRVPQRAEFAPSISDFGVRFAMLSEDLSSHIDTDAEALELAELMVSEMSRPSVDASLEMPYFWLLELNDLFSIAPDVPAGGGLPVSYDYSYIYAVTGIVHNFAENGDATTTLSGSLSVRVAMGEWLRGRQRVNQVKLGEPAGPGLNGDLWAQPEDLTLPTVL